MKRVWRARWFILATLIFLFFATFATKVMAASGMPEFGQILTAATNGLKEYFKFLLDMLVAVW